MRSVTTTLRDFIQGSTDAIVVDLLTLTLASAAEFRWTNHQEDITSGGNTWTSGGTGTAPLVSRGKIRDVVGLDPSELEITLSCGSTAELGAGIKLPAAAAAGVLDAAQVKLERCYLDEAGAVIGTLTRFQGQTSDVQFTGAAVTLRVRSELDRLNVSLPRNLYRPLCSHALGDAGCGVVLSAYAYSGTVNGSPTPTVFTSSAAGAGADYYTGGYLVFTSGALNGQRRAVTAYNNGTTQFTVEYPFSQAPGVGDTFTAYPGCDKAITTCNAKFGNLPRRRGFDFVPPPDSVTS